MATVAVFGASGKLGRHLLPLLAERGDTVKALVHRTPVKGPRTTCVTGSVSDPEAVAATVADADIVICLATTKEDPETFFEVSLRGTFNILEACRRSRPQQIVLVSGDCVFGIWFYPQPIPIDENHPLTAYPGYYAFSKVMEEQMLRQYAIQYDLPVTILRSSWVFEGDDLLNHFSLLRNVDPAEPGHGFGDVGEEALSLVRCGEERIPVLLDADGRPLHRHIVHVDDVIHGFARALGNLAAIGQDFNLAAPAPFDYRVAADYLSSRLGVPTIDLRQPAYHSFAINITKARSLLGYTPQQDFHRMADRAVAIATRTVD